MIVQSSLLLVLLPIVAGMQAVMAVLNLRLDRLLKWESELVRMPLLFREVFQVHKWFISVTLAIFAAMTWRFGSEMAHGTDAACQWLAALIGAFWAIRTLLQVAYYSSSHWRGRLDRTVIHVILLSCYGGFSFVYLVSAFGPH